MKKIIITSLLIFVFVFVIFSQNKKNLTISVTWKKASGIGSNQCAVWIEDAEHNFIKTIYVSKFTGKGGFIKRTDCLVKWREKAKITKQSLKDIDSVTAATPKKGENKFVWDLTDNNGNNVPLGIYYYRVESTLYFNEHVLWSGKIDLTKNDDNTQATSEYFPENTNRKGVTVIKVAGVYK